MVASRGYIAAVALATLVACGDGTGIVIEVTRDAETTPEDIDRLEFFIGVETEPGAGLSGDFAGDPDEGATFTGGRDLLADPYRLLLRRGGDMPSDAAVMVFVLAFRDQTLVGFGGLAQPAEFLDGKVTEWHIEVAGDRGDRVDVTDTGCLIWTSDTGQVVIASPDDHDCDNDAVSVDCDDEDPTVGPSRGELCANEIDDDCDDVVDEQDDADMDGVLNCEDCDDADELRFPGNPETCDGIDNDCNGVCDDGELDSDGDTYTVCDRKILDDGTCSDPSESLFDCNDDDPTSYPGADEVCDGFDNDCNAHCDETFDEDGDTYTTCGSVVDACEGTRAVDVDCEPGEMSVHPEQPEICDGFDTNCDGTYFRADNPCYVVDPQGGGCTVGSRACGDAEGTGWGDCVPGGDGSRVPSELCEAYADCDAMNVPDPFSCANEAVPTTEEYACTVFFNGTNGALCANREVSLPSSSETGCVWQIVGGTQQTFYQVGLRSIDNAGSDPSVADCAAVLGVVSSLVPVPQPDTFILYETVADAPSTLIRLGVTAESVVDCPENGFVCTGLVAPALP